MSVVDLMQPGGHGPVWGVASEELNVTLLVWRPGEGQPEHVNVERDVVLVALAGSGTVVVDGVGESLRAGQLALLPRGSRRSVTAGADGLRCLSVHRRRGGLTIARPR